MTRWFVRPLKESGSWQSVPPRGDEPPAVDTIRLLLEAPDFLGPLSENAGIPCAALPAPDSTTRRVLITVDEAGCVRLVACPEQEDADLGSLVTDVLAASGRLWHQSYDNLARPFEERHGKKLVVQVGERAQTEWSPQSFKSGVEASLKQGRFPVVVVARHKTGPIQDMVEYLLNMNLDARAICYRAFRGESIEAIQPVEEDIPDRKRVKPPPKPEPKPKPEPEKKRGKSIIFGEMAKQQFTPRVSFTAMRDNEKKLSEYPPFPQDQVTDQQRPILEHLRRIDDIGLRRKGFEYFLPGSEKQETLEGTIVVSVDPERWPFPNKNEIVVVVNTGKRYLARYLGTAPDDIDDFLASLPRVTRKEHKGCLLLRAANIHEADQMVNELNTLVTTFRSSPAMATAKPEPAPAEKQGAGVIPILNVTARQQEMLAELERLEDLNLLRDGYGYFTPGTKRGSDATPLIQVCAESSAWPAPGKDQLIVVVNPDESHLSRHLQISPQEIDEFLGNLPRVRREDTQGCILLRADTVEEASAMVGELKALFEIASTST